MISTNSLPERMAAWRLHDFGAPDVLRLEQVAVPRPGPGEALVEVAFCGICRHDLLTRAGAFPNVPRPLTLGHQASGRVVALGEDCELRVGDRVMSLIFAGCGECEACRRGEQAVCLTGRAQFMGDDFDGGYAEYLCVDEGVLTRIPDELPLDVAAVASCTLGTAYHGLHTRGEVTDGDTVVITGASGGIGLHAIEVAKLLGARVIAVTSRATSESTLRNRGADEVVVITDGAFAREVKALTDDVGADVVLEVVGTPTLGQSVHAVRTGGRIVVLGNVEGSTAAVRPAHLILKEISLVGTKSCSESELHEVLDHILAGDLSVDIARRLPLEEAAMAHEDMEEGQTTGRLVLEIAGEAP